MLVELVFQVRLGEGREVSLADRALVRVSESKDQGKVGYLFYKAVGPSTLMKRI